MKAISLWQPWATLWVLQIKRNETRSWAFPHWYTGSVAIHAAKKKINIYADLDDAEWREGILKALNKAGIEYIEMKNGKSYRTIKGFAQGIEVLKFLAEQREPVGGKHMAESLRMPYDGDLPGAVGRETGGG